MKITGDLAHIIKEDGGRSRLNQLQQLAARVDMEIYNTWNNDKVVAFAAQTSVPYVDFTK